MSEDIIYEGAPTVAQLMIHLGITADVTDGTPPSENFEPLAKGYTVNYAFEGRTLSLHFYTGTEYKGKVTGDMVLSTYLSETSLTEIDFEEFASECGYDPDSRKAEKIYNTMREKNAEIREFLGEHFAEFLEAD
jgi:hypothetical protein